MLRKTFRSATVLLLGLAGALEGGQLAGITPAEVEGAVDAAQSALVVLTFIARFRANAGAPITGSQESR
jgi:hypothetical protein